MGQLKYKPGDTVRNNTYTYGYVQEYLSNSWYRIISIYPNYKGVSVRTHSRRVNELHRVTDYEMNRVLEGYLNRSTNLNSLLKKATPGNAQEVVRLMRSYIRGNKGMLKEAVQFATSTPVPVPTFEEISKYDINHYDIYSLADLRSAA